MHLDPEKTDREQFLEDLYFIYRYISALESLLKIHY